MSKVVAAGRYVWNGALQGGEMERHQLQLEPGDSGTQFGELLLMGAVGDQMLDQGDQHRSIK